MTIPICAVTGRIAGDADACGDCDPCGAAHMVPDAIKGLLTEKEEWRQKYGTSAAEIERLQAALERANAVSERRKNKKEVAVTAREDHRRGLEYWRERAMSAEAKLAGSNEQKVPREFRLGDEQTADQESKL